MRVLSKLLATGLLTLAVACGGASDSPPGPLARHFDDMFIADIPLDQKQSVVQAQNDWSVAKMENAKAEADYNEATATLTGVRNDHKASKLTLDTALANKKQADKSADNNRINQAAKELHGAETNVKAAASRVTYFEAYRNWLKVQWRYGQEAMYWREAQYELAKSTLAQKNNKAPRGVQYDWFPTQTEDRSKRVQAAKGKADGQAAKATSARQTWLGQQASADKEMGTTSKLDDPMAPKVSQPTVGTTGATAAGGAPAPATPTTPATPAPAPAPSE